MLLEFAPLVEAWIELQLEATDSERTWPQNINEFLGRLRETFPDQQYLLERKLELRKLSESGVPSEVKAHSSIGRVRAFDQVHSKCVQAGENLYVFNMPQGQEYQGFETLLASTLEYFTVYCDYFRPQRVRKAILHYLNLISFPVERSDGVNLREYFNLGVTVPDESTWPLEKFAVNFVVPVKAMTGGEDRVAVEFHSEDQAAEVGQFRARLAFHLVAQQVETLDHQVISDRLLNLHNQARRIFQESVSEKLWKRFGQIGD